MKRLLVRLLTLLCLLPLLLGKKSDVLSRRRSSIIPRQSSQSNGLQNNVTWDEYSYKINGKRVMLFSGEVHPYRLPVPGLYLDIFQKIKAMGFNTVSFYVFWGLLEPKRGEISFEGFRDLQPFFDAAKKAGIYLIARPGPYINAETTAGGFPGWGTYTPGIWRTSNATYLDAYASYIKAIGAKIVENEITQGGPIILVQSENEYSTWQAPYTEDRVYEDKLKKSLLDSGITVPITTNDAWPNGHYTSVDIYGYDSYPNGFDCSHPSTWKSDAIPETYWNAHQQYTPKIPNAVYEFQGGAFDGWGGSGYDTCAVLTGPHFERVFYKNEIAMSTTFLNLYMIYGGTNWGGIAHPGVYTSYDYGSAIAEDRTLREKFYELKLQANFLAVSPAYLTSRPKNAGKAQGAFTGNSALKTTQVLDAVGNKTGFYVVRQSDGSANGVQRYTWTVPTSLGSLAIPTVGGSLTLTGKDSKIHVVDYPAGSTNLLYSTGEILTWATIDGQDIIIVYGDTGEVHETAVKFNSSTTTPIPRVVSGTGAIKTKAISGGALALQYTTTGKTVVQLGTTLFYIVDRANAYDFWVLQPTGTNSNSSVAPYNGGPIIVKGGYLLRTATVDRGTLAITGDLNATASFEIFAPSAITDTVTFNGADLELSGSSYGALLAQKSANLPTVSLPDLSSLNWKAADSLPEISSTYSDAAWTTADRNSSVNPTKLSTPVVLYAGDYGYHIGNILWRAHFNATGSETAFKVKGSGGVAFAYSVWLDSNSIGSWEGDAVHSNYEGTFKFPSTLTKGSSHVITILQDHMGYEEDWTAASDSFKSPRGILSYSFVGSSTTTVGLWKVTGNLGGESYVDKTRGPLNEGGLYAERQGWHLPGFKDATWSSGKPTTGISKTGVSFYRTNFTLNVPSGVDYPMALVVTNSTTNTHYRAQFYVNGNQFGKYVNHIGPQKVFPVPQGILNYKGENTLAVSLWAASSTGAKLNSLALQLTAKVETSLSSIANAPAPAWTERPGAY